jgi:hypothetical protein
MDQEPLVTEQIEDGKRLIERLVNEGVSVTAAGWVKETENGRWYLYLASNLVGDDGATRPAYSRINATVRQMPQLVWIRPLKVKAIAPSDPVAQAAVEISRRYPSKHPIRLGGGDMGGVSVDEVYIYPPLAATVPGGTARP